MATCVGRLRRRTAASSGGEKILLARAQIERAERVSVREASGIAAQRLQALRGHDLAGGTLRDGGGFFDAEHPPLASAENVAGDGIVERDYRVFADRAHAVGKVEHLQPQRAEISAS